MAKKKPSIPMTISVRCSGQTIIIGIYEHNPGEGEGVNPRYTYTVMDNTAIELLATDEEPIVEGGRVSGWFHQDVMDKLFSDATGEEMEGAWFSFCKKYLKRADKITSWVQVLKQTQKVVSYPHRILEITIDGHTCLLEGSQALDPKSFVEWFLYRFNSLVVMSGAYWAEVVTHWMDDAEEGEEQESLAPGMECVNKVLNYIRERADRMTFRKEDMEKNPGMPYFVDGAIRLSGTIIEPMAQKAGIKMRKLASKMKDYLVGPVKQDRVGKKHVNFWRFDPEKVGIDVQKRLDDEIEDDTDGEG